MADKRYDPDGNEKRRARKGEVPCGICFRYEPSESQGVALCESIIRLKNGGPLAVPCRADDCAMDCAHFLATQRC